MVLENSDKNCSPLKCTAESLNIQFTTPPPRPIVILIQGWEFAVLTTESKLPSEPDNSNPCYLHTSHTISSTPPHPQSHYGSLPPVSVVTPK